MSERWRLDMHTHCEHSPDSRTTVAAQARAIRAAGIDVVCCTDHDTIAGGQRLREIADGFTVIIGEEVTSRDGEIIGLFLERAVPRGLSAEETIARIREQGGIVSVPHPFSHNRIHRIRRDALERVAATVDCLEIFNAREAFAADNRHSLVFARERGLAGAVGSDAHRASEIGNAWLEIEPFEGRDDFVAAVRRGTANGRLAGTGVHLLTRYDKLRKWLSGRTTPSS